MSVEQIVHEAMALPPEEKAKLAEQLLASLEGPQWSEIDAAWTAEAERRIDAYRAGQEAAMTVEEAVQEIRLRLGRR